MNRELWSFQSDLALLWRAISLNPYKILTWNIQYYHILNIALTWQILIKFRDGSCPSLDYFALFGVEWPICDLGVDISIIHVCILMQNYVLNFKKHTLDFKGHLERTTKAIGSQNSFFRFQSWCWAAIMNSKGTLLEKSHVKKIKHCNWPRKFRGHRVSIMGGLGWYSPH